MNGILLLVDQRGMADACIKGLDLDKDNIKVLVIGSREIAIEASGNANNVLWIDTKGTPVENWAMAVADVVAKESPAAIVGAFSPGVRSLLGTIAVKMGAPMIKGAISLKLSEDTASIDRFTIGDRLIETIQAPAPVCLLSNALEPSQEQISANENLINEIAVNVGPVAIEDAGLEPTAGSHLVGAQRVVSAGRGVKQKEDMAMVQDLADVLNAEVGCSMPLADERGWLPKDSFVGWSGAHINPQLYVALGISGTYQHLFGIKNAQAIVCINSDPKAPFFQNSDYGIVGDLYEIVPKLIKALK
jgi:electron transfer flavoprotein alpha subunit